VALGAFSRLSPRQLDGVPGSPPFGERRLFRRGAPFSFVYVPATHTGTRSNFPASAEAAGRGQEIETAGGVFRRFTSLIQLPRGTQRVADGTHVVITNDPAGSEVRIRGEVLKFDAGQLHARLWI